MIFFAHNLHAWFHMPLSHIRIGSQSSHLVSPSATNLVVVMEARVMQDTKLPAFFDGLCWGRSFCAMTY